MKNTNISQCAKVEVLTAKKLETTLNRPRELFKSGYLGKGQISKLLNRSRQTLHTWDQLLINFIPDYAKYWAGERKPLTHYHFCCLQRLSKYQNRAEPYKSEDDLISYITRNIELFSLQTYIEHHRG